MHSLRPLINATLDDLSCFHGTRPLNNKCIDAYFRMIERRSMFYKEIPSVCAFDSSVYTSIMNGNYEEARSTIEGVNLFSKDLLLLPIYFRDINKGGFGHWSLVVVWMKKQQLISYGIVLSDRLTSKILLFLKKVAAAGGDSFNTLEWTTTQECSPKLMWGCGFQTCKETETTRFVCNCGVYICTYADVLSRVADIATTKIDPKSERRNICCKIRRGKFENEEFKFFEQTPGDRMLFSSERQGLVSIEPFIRGVRRRVKLPGDPVLEQVSENLQRFPLPSRIFPVFGKLRRRSPVLIESPPAKSAKLG